MLRPVGEVVADHRQEDEQARGRVDAESEADPEAVDEAVDREAGGTEHADPRAGESLDRLGAVVEDEQPLSEEEAEEAGGDEGSGDVVVADVLEALREDVQELGAVDAGAADARQPPVDLQRRDRAALPSHGREPT
ncbi:MAG: hypothetical protein ACTHKT_07655 [Solirubrobacterales bacterium]